MGDPLVAAIALALGIILAVVGSLAWARHDARTQEARAGDAEFREATGRAVRAEQRAADLERQRTALVSAGRSYLAALPGDGASRERLLLAIDLTEHAAGASGPPPKGDGLSGPGLGVVG